MLRVTPVILCGGSGTRLWPLSRSESPKQFIPLFDDESLFVKTINRLDSLNNDELEIDEIIIVASNLNRFDILDQLKCVTTKSRKYKIILEPNSKNTAPALTLAALEINRNHNDSLMFVMPSDHMVEDIDGFKKSILNAIQAAKNNAFVVFGIRPDRPETGYGYIKFNGDFNFDTSAIVDNFIEKPPQKIASKIYLEKNYLWNSGIFLMRASVWLDAIKALNYSLFINTLKSFEKMKIDNNFLRPDFEAYEKNPNISIDYAVIEKIPNSNFNIYVVLLDAGWNDVGSWQSFSEVARKDNLNNIKKGDSLLVKTSNCTVVSLSRLVCCLGLENLVIIETPDAILVADKNSSQDVKSITTKLSKLNRLESKNHRKVNRPWGSFDTIDEGKNHKVKKIQVSPKCSISLQKHNFRSEHWVVIKGVAEVICDGNKIYLNENESTFIPKKSKHRLTNIGDNILEIIEVQTGSYLGEDDIYRYEDNYGREDK